MKDITVLYIIFGIIGVGLLTVAVFLGIHIFRRWKTRSILFQVFGLDGKIKVFRVKNPKKKVKLDGKSYIYDEKAEVRDFWNKTIFYYENNPQAIIFDASKHENKLSSQALDNVLEDEFIRKVFNPTNALSASMILSYLTLGLLAVILYFVFTGDINVKISDPDTLKTIGEACKTAITGK